MNARDRRNDPPSIVGFLAARIDEDEADATTACSGESPYWLHHIESGLVHADTWCLNNGLNEWVADCLTDAGPHIARHDPARTLREVTAKRAILNEYRNLTQTMARDREKNPWFVDDDTYAAEAALRKVVTALAAVYADHPDYDQSWG
ncbi:DUF6221 family protein [Rhodococcus jostii]|uniref:DUF6221 family protein n=1 Tax=Rhodococcus jostii TaxID=132919 RepID=UPI0036253998